MLWTHKLGVIGRGWVRTARIPPVIMQQCRGVHRIHRSDPVIGHDDNNREDGSSTDTEDESTFTLSNHFRPPQLPDPPYGIPQTAEFEAERLGGFSKEWLQQELPNIERLISAQSLLPQKEVLWQTAPHIALEAIARWRSYHDVLKIIMEHSFFFLFENLPFSHDAPMPHVVYEDMMKALTFSSLQLPPMEHFALPSKTLRTLLCMAAYYCTLDKHYFTSASLLFRQMEQQQKMGAEVLSAWVFVCTAAGEIDQALAGSVHMAERGLDFHPEVFAMMQSPSLSPVTLHEGVVGRHVIKGLVMRQRLCRRLSTSYSAATVALHAMFVYYALTLQHTTKWELLSRAVWYLESSTLSGLSGSSILPAPRTIRLALHIFAQEKGVLCGPRTVKAFVWCLCNEQTALSAAAVVFVLLRVRRNEVSEAFKGLPTTAFAEEEIDAIQMAVRHRAQVDASFRLATTLIGHLVADSCWYGDPQQPSSGMRGDRFYKKEIGDESCDALSRHAEKKGTSATDERHEALRAILSRIQLMGRAASETKGNASGNMVKPAADEMGENILSYDVAELTASSQIPAKAAPDAALCLGGHGSDFQMGSSHIASSDFHVAVYEFVQTLRGLDQLCKPKNTEAFHEFSTAPLPLAGRGGELHDPGDYFSKTPNQEDLGSNAIHHALTRFGIRDSQRAWTEKILKQEVEVERLRQHLPNAWIGLR